MDLQTLADRMEITDLLTRYATAVDRQDWELYRTVFTPEAHIDYTASGGPMGDLEEVIVKLSDTLRIFTRTQHYVSNIDAKISGDTATVRAMFFNPMVVRQGRQFFCGGWYNHELVRTKEGWRSAKLSEEMAWFDRVEEAFAE